MRKVRPYHRAMKRNIDKQGTTDRPTINLRIIGLFVFALLLSVSLIRQSASLTQVSNCDAIAFEMMMRNAAGRGMIPIPRKELNLVLFVALGTESAIPTVHHNVFSHFLDWDCIVYVHKNETYVSPDGQKFKEIMSKCSIVRMPGMYWEHFLMTLAPELVQQYEHVAVLLDDLFAPSQGDTPVNVTKLLQQMREHNVSSISPSVKGSAWSTTNPSDDRCLWHVEQIETFFQIFSREMFQCWHSYMHFSNRQGWCLDLCLDKQMCPLISNLAVDASMIAYHIGYQLDLESFIPESALAGTNLTGSTFRGGTGGSLVLCDSLGGCPNYFPNTNIIACHATD